MGQTLTHGVYLPDEGERNCYSGLAANWQILDTSVGTIAAHTAALAGKAPAVHTHTKADITDFPVYGTAAGTICEGNDSRLSDARTPVAHTHGKSDVTDLFNSANTWSNDQIIASSNDKSYYVKDTVYELGQTYSNGEHLGGLTFQDKNGATVGLLDIVDRSYGNMEMRIMVQQKFDPNSNNRSTSGTTIFHELVVGIGPSKETYVTLNGSLRAGTNNAYNLGTSSKKWKSLNGINPGALSLPDKNKRIAIDTTGWTYTGSYANQILINGATQTISGWLYIRIENTTASDYVAIRMNTVVTDNPTLIQPGSSATSVISVLFPVVASVPVYIYATKAPAKIYLYECLGNV